MVSKAKPAKKTGKPRGRTAPAKPVQVAAAADPDNPKRVDMFILEYIIDLNGAQAAIRAGYSAKTAAAAASRLLRNVNVRARINAEVKARAERTRTDADWVLTRLRMELDADLVDLYDANGQLKPMREWPLIWRTGLVQQIHSQDIMGVVDEEEVPVGKAHQLKIGDRLPRLLAIGKHVKVNAFKETVELGAEGALKKAFEQMTGNVFTPKEDR